MSKRSAALPIGVAVALGVTFWLLLGRDEPGSKKEASAAKVTDRPGTAARGGGGTPGGGDAPGGGVILIDDDPKGALRLEGQVIDAHDEPVGGATVVLSSNPPRTTTTEDDGSFAFDALVGRPYQLVARAPAGVAGPITARLTAESPPVILKLRDASKVTVEVVDDKGAPVDGASIELRGLDTQTATTAKGTATIAPVVPGWYGLAAWAPGFARSYQWLQVAGDSTTARVALRRGARVAGRVVDEQGEPVEGARVIFRGASDWSVQIDERRDGQLTGKDGRFAFDAIAAGSVRFDARHPEYAPGSTAIVTLDGTTPVDNVEIVLQAGATVAGTVVDAKGAPVASARVRIGVAASGFIASGPRQVFSDDAGAFEVRGLPRRALEAVAVGDVGASETTPVDASAGDVRGVKLEVDVTGTIAGVVVDPAGEPIEGIQVSAGPDFTSGGGGDFRQWRLRGVPEDLTDAAGHFTLTGLAPGDYRLRASRSGRRRGPGPQLGDTVTAKAGDTNVKLVLPLDGALSGKVVFDDGKVPATFTVDVAWQAEPFATADGSFRLGELPPGDYDLNLRGTGFEPKTIHTKVESGKETDLGTIQVRKGRTIRGVVVSGGAPVAGATVYCGNGIFGNGTTNAAGGFGGPPGLDTRTTTTDESGAFSIAGFAKRDLVIVAEHEQHGRSTTIRLPFGDPNEQSLRIALLPFGSMTGTVTEGGRPSEGQIVSVQSTTAPGAMYGVASGADGTFRLDRLAPDTYKVSAIVGMNPMRGMGFFSKNVVVESGKETKVDVTIQRGTITLAVTPQAAGATGITGWGAIVAGAITASNGKELELRLAQQDGAFSNRSVFLPGQPMTIRELTAGSYTVCLLPLPAGLPQQQMYNYAMRHAEELPAFCKAVTVTAQPNEQSTTIDVALPPLIADE